MPFGRALLRIILALTVVFQLECFWLIRASDYTIKSWGVDDGMAQSSVTDIAQTPDGYIWIGTLLSGLSRFDGLRFVNFDTANTPSLTSSGIRRLLVDSQGILWVNDYENNLLQLRGNGFVSVGAPPVKLGSLLRSRVDSAIFVTLDGEVLSGKLNAGSNWIWTLIKSPPLLNPNYVADAEGNLWYRTPEFRLGRLMNSQFQVLEHPAGLESRQVLSLTKDSAERLWVGTDDGVFVWTGNRFTNAAPIGDETKLAIRQILSAGRDKLWVEANGNLRLMSHHAWQNKVAGWDSQNLPWSRLRALRSDNEGGMWISLGTEGLAHVGAEGSLTRLTSADGLPSQLVQAFFVDHDGNLWTGYHRGGLLQISQRQFHPVARAEGLQDTVVTSITEGALGAIWIGTAGGTVAQWTSGTCTNYALPLRGNFCQDVVICGGPDGRVWIGTGGNGLLVEDRGVFRHVVEPGELTSGVRLLHVQKNGQVWFTTFNNLFRLADENPVRVLEFKSAAQVAAAIAEGPNGELWVGTIGGALRRFSSGQWADFVPADQQPSSRFWSMLPGADGSVWIGTQNRGLLRFKDGKFTRITTADGLADNSISQIIDDGAGHFWLGAHAGVMCVSKAALERRAEGDLSPLICRVFGRSDGLLTTALSLEFQPNCFLAKNGSLWFGSANGASWLRPGDLRASQLPAPVIIESVTVDGKSLPVSAASPNATLTSVPDKPSIAVGPGVKNLEVHFTAPNFTAPELIQYKYRLEGLDAEWTPVGNRRLVTYTHLPPGKFTFRATAGNSDGVWNETGAAFELTVKPHLWQRTWFIVSFLFTAACILAYVVRRITRNRMQRKLDKLERQRELERERSRIAQDLHDDLGAALTEISLTSDFMQKTAHDPDMVRECIREIGCRARELFSAMDEIVWAVNPRNDSTVSLAAYFCQYAQHQLKPAGIACRLDIDPDLPSLPLNAEQRHQVFLAFKEAVNNVIRHSQAGEMKLTIATINHDLSIHIKDDGCGFEPALALAGADGLINMPERMARIGGSCRVASQLKQGTQVELRVPLSQSKMKT